MGKTLSMYLTTPILTLGTAAVKASLDFESSFAGVRKTVEATEAEFTSLAAWGALSALLRRQAVAKRRLGLLRPEGVSAVSDDPECAGCRHAGCS